MNRKILLVEPNYKNKYPPMGLMKLSTYYKNLGDKVTFFKGDLKELVLEDIYKDLLEQLYANCSEIFWEKYKPAICNYLKKGSTESYDEIPFSNENPLVRELLKYYRKYYYNKEYFKPENRKWDRIGITTLFTFYWDITIETINFVKQLCKDDKDVMIGGVMASILPERVQAATGIYPFVGTLNRAGILDDNDMIIDSLPLDYSILHEIDYEYPASDGYMAYMTRGCVNKCKFCAVPKLEPEFKNFIPISKQIEITNMRFGGKKDLLLLDNNVLASCQFDEIIDDIKRAGFKKGSMYQPPNMFEVAVQNLKDGYNDNGYIRCVVKLYQELVKKYGEKIQSVYNILESKGLLEYHTAKKEAIFETYDVVKELFNEMSKKKSRKRIVDFNQGIDARLITDANMKKLAEIPVAPVRIAFDNWKMHEKYEYAVRTAVKNGHTNLSNYILYNYDDEPIELYKRLRLNIDLCEELGASIYSFPMKYHPIEDPEYFSNRDFVGKNWNRKFVRTIQAILNSTKGKVGKGFSFFCRAFGEDEDKFNKLLYMPEAMIIYRLFYEEKGITDKWWKCFCSLAEDKLEVAKKIIEKNDFSDINKVTDDKEILELLKFYTIRREDAEQEMSEATQ